MASLASKNARWLGGGASSLVFPGRTSRLQRRFHFAWDAITGATDAAPPEGSVICLILELEAVVSPFSLNSLIYWPLGWRNDSNEGQSIIIRGERVTFCESHRHLLRASHAASKPRTHNGHAVMEILGIPVVVVLCVDALCVDALGGDGGWFLLGDGSGAACC